MNNEPTVYSTGLKVHPGEEENLLQENLGAPPKTKHFGVTDIGNFFFRHDFSSSSAFKSCSFVASEKTTTFLAISEKVWLLLIAADYTLVEKTPQRGFGCNP